MKGMEIQRACSRLQSRMEAVKNNIKDCATLHANSSTMKNIIKGKFTVVQYQEKSGPGKSASVRIYSSTKVDPSTGMGKLSKKAYLKHGKSKKQGGTKSITYHTIIHVEPDFGNPGAFLITNKHKHRFFLESATLEVQEYQIFHFDCRSWVYPIKKTKSARLFFSNHSYLPNETPIALMELRKSEIKSLQGNGTGERKEWDRIYDYAYYNDLGNPDEGQEQARPIFGGTEHPYPRRGRTGRPPSRTDHLTESPPEFLILDVYVPPDEHFSPKKMSEFISHSVRASVHLLVPEAKSLFKNDSSNFESFEEIHEMFSSNRDQSVEAKVTEKLKTLVPNEIVKEITRANRDYPMKFPLPQIIAENELAWRDDEEFGRQMLAGTNPTRIQCLKRFPPEGNYGGSSIQAIDIDKNLEGLTIQDAMNQWRLFILDHHDYLMPFLDRINTNGVCAYASRTLFFLKADATLSPIAIELSLPSYSEEEKDSRVFCPATEGTEAALWQLAKTHVAVNDSAYHLLVSHWLHTHAVVEPFIIATKRQLSAMHPIYRLLDPHFKDTMHANALARNLLISSGMILEKILFSGELSMELSSEFYKEWRFDEQALPTDLLKRRMALEDTDPENPTGVQLLFDDYPYGADGLEIWSAIKKWVTDFCLIFYKEDESLISDSEIQEWWSEIKNVGHGDKCSATWWYEMKTVTDLIQILTTLIWIASALHASVNFGLYSYAGYPPNRPMLCRKFIPEEGTKKFATFLKDPDKYFLNMLPGKLEMTLGIALVEVLSRHTSDEMYLGQRPLEWTDDKKVQEKFHQFKENLQQIEKTIFERNINPHFKNRRGLAKIPYNLLLPNTSNDGRKGGITGKGIPNSITI